MRSASLRFLIFSAKVGSSIFLLKLCRFSSVNLIFFGLDPCNSGQQWWLYLAFTAPTYHLRSSSWTLGARLLETIKGFELGWLYVVSSVASLVVSLKDSGPSSRASVAKTAWVVRPFSAILIPLRINFGPKLVSVPTKPCKYPSS
jgi:hypothetical protein